MPLLIYTVQPGDTVWKIANLYGSTVQEIARHNNMTNPDLILPGQTLLIPVSDNLRETPPGSLLYTVQPGDTLYILSLLFRVSIESILALNNIPSPFTIYPGMLIVLPPNAVNPFLPVQPGIIRYTVLPGDTVYRIASRFGISVQSILGEPVLFPDSFRSGLNRSHPRRCSSHTGAIRTEGGCFDFRRYIRRQTVRLLQMWDIT